MKNSISPTNFEDHFGLHCSVNFRPQYVWFRVYLYVALIPNSSSQLAETIVYSHQILLAGSVYD